MGAILLPLPKLLGGVLPEHFRIRPSEQIANQEIRVFSEGKALQVKNSRSQATPEGIALGWTGSGPGLLTAQNSAH